MIQGLKNCLETSAMADINTNIDVEKSFNEIAKLNNRAIQKVLWEIDNIELSKALIPANSEVQNKIFENLSKCASVMLKEDMENMRPVFMHDAVDAQRKILLVIYNLAFEEKIRIPESFCFPDDFTPFNHQNYRKIFMVISPAIDLNNMEFNEAFYCIFERIMGFSRLADYEGLLELEGHIDNEKANSHDIFEYGMRLVVDRISNQIIDKILSNIINQENDESLLRLKNIQKEAVLMIQQNVNPRIFILNLITQTDISMDDERITKAIN